MKIIISESQYESIIINELLLLPIDIERINRNGESVEEEHDFGPFTLVLVKNKNSNEYQIGITTKNTEFSSYESQKDKKTEKSVMEILKVWKQIIDKIKEWLKLYNNLKIGSTNLKKTEKYHRILKNFGLKVSDIIVIRNLGSTFTIYK